MNAVDIISRALRRIGVIAAGQLPSDDQLSDAIDALKALLLRAVSEGALGELADVIADDGDFTAPEFSRVTRNSVATTSIILPERVIDCGESRLPRDGAVIVVADQFEATKCTYIYDGDWKQWLAVETMDSTSLVPLAERDANGLAAYLALELADEYGLEPGQTTVFAAQRFQANILNGWSREQTRTPRPEAYF